MPPKTDIMVPGSVNVCPGNSIKTENISIISSRKMDTRARLGNVAVDIILVRLIEKPTNKRLSMLLMRPQLPQKDYSIHLWNDHLNRLD